MIKSQELGRYVEANIIKLDDMSSLGEPSSMIKIGAHSFTPHDRW